MSAGALNPDPAGGPYSTPPDSLGIFEGPTSNERKGKRGSEKKNENV